MAGMETDKRTTGSSEFGVLLRRYRVAAGLSQEALAERARMSTEGISALERGFRRTPQRATLAQLATALELGDEEVQDLEEAAARRVLLNRGGGASVTVGPWSARGSASLPLSPKSFVGRESELGEIVTLVRDHRLVTLTGAGGIGKTQTALQVATALSAAEGAICFVELAPLSDSSLVVAAVASALGVQEVPNRVLLETLRAFLKNKSLLLILDNCEHVIREAARVAEALTASCGRLRVLATSREPLRAAGEFTYRLTSLDAESASVLFADRACAVDRRFALTNETAPVVSEICRHLDGIPLAIELAAARVDVLPLGALTKKLDNRFGLLTSGQRTVLPRQQTMRAAIDWSYDLLAPQEQRVFERLSVFAGGATLAAASVVCSDEGVVEDDVFERLSSLADKSMVVVELERNEPRYHFLESFRQYAGEKLTLRGERDMVARRYARVCLEQAERFGLAFDTEPDDVWGQLAHDELDNWRAVLQWALNDRGDAVLGQRLAAELTMVWHFLAPSQGRDWVGSAIACVDERTPPQVVALLSYAEAWVAFTFFDGKRTLESSELAIVRYRALGDQLGTARAQRLAGCELAHLGRFAEAEALLCAALQTGRKLNNRKLVANILLCLAGANYKVGDLVAARRYLGEAVPIYEALGARFGIASAMGALANYEFSAGNAELALRHGTATLEAFRAANHTQGVAIGLTNMALYLISLARYDEAEQRARAALALAIELQQDALAASALLHIAVVAARRAELESEGRLAAYAGVARLLGFVEPFFAVRGAPFYTDKYQEFDPLLSLLQGALEPDQLTKLMAEGAAMMQEKAIEEVSLSSD